MFSGITWVFGDEGDDGASIFLVLVPSLVRGEEMEHMEPPHNGEEHLGDLLGRTVHLLQGDHAISGTVFL